MTLPAHSKPIVTGGIFGIRQTANLPPRKDLSVLFDRFDVPEARSLPYPVWGAENASRIILECDRRQGFRGRGLALGALGGDFTWRKGFTPPLLPTDDMQCAGGETQSQDT